MYVETKRNDSQKVSWFLQGREKKKGRKTTTLAPKARAAWKKILRKERKESSETVGKR